MQADRFTDLPHRRRVAGLRRVLADEVEDLLLPLGQVQFHRRSGSSAPASGSKSRKLPSNTCSQGYRLPRTPQPAPSPCTQTSRIDRPQAAVAELVDAQG